MKNSLYDLEGGFKGKDSMREKATRMFAHELSSSDTKIPQSMSSPAHTKMRTFKEGGKINKLTETQSNMRIPRRIKAEPIKSVPLEKSEMLKRGGRANGGRGKKHMFLGGLISSLAGPILGGIGSLLGGGGNSSNNSNNSSNESRRRPRRRRDEDDDYDDDYAEGGRAMRSGLKMKQIPKKTMPIFREEVVDVAPESKYSSTQSSKPFKKGGKSKNKKCYESGGSIYERQMVGEKPSNKRVKNNYESEMRGERPIKSSTKDGKVKMAIGGAGKIRHKQSTPRGRKIVMKKTNRGI